MRYLKLSLQLPDCPFKILPGNSMSLFSGGICFATGSAKPPWTPYNRDPGEKRNRFAILRIHPFHPQKIENRLCLSFDFRLFWLCALCVSVAKKVSFSTLLPHFLNPISFPHNHFHRNTYRKFFFANHFWFSPRRWQKRMKKVETPKRFASGFLPSMFGVQCSMFPPRLPDPRPSPILELFGTNWKSLEPFF